MENPPASPKSNGLISLLDDLSPLALCSNEDRTILFVSQRNSPTILKVAVSCTGTVLKAESESFITISRKACCTALAYNKETRDILVANSENDGGIYIVDTAKESGKATCVKVIHNGTGVCSRAYSLAVSDTGDIFFTNVDERKIARSWKAIQQNIPSDQKEKHLMTVAIKQPHLFSQQAFVSKETLYISLTQELEH